MNLQVPKVGVYIATVGLPGYPSDKPRYAIITAPTEGGFKLATLTTDEHELLKPHQAIKLTTSTHPSLYRSKTNQYGLPPVNGKLSLERYRGDSAFFVASIKISVKVLITENPVEIVTIQEKPHGRASKADWEKICNACPATYRQNFADYDAI